MATAAFLLLLPPFGERLVRVISWVVIFISLASTEHFHNSSTASPVGIVDMVGGWRKKSYSQTHLKIIIKRHTVIAKTDLCLVGLFPAATCVGTEALEEIFTPVEMCFWG